MIVGFLSCKFYKIVNYNGMIEINFKHSFPNDVIISWTYIRK